MRGAKFNGAHAPFEFRHLKPTTLLTTTIRDDRAAPLQLKGEFRGEEFKFQMLSLAYRARCFRPADTRHIIIPALYNTHTGQCVELRHEGWKRHVRYIGEIPHKREKRKRWQGSSSLGRKKKKKKAQIMPDKWLPYSLRFVECEDRIFTQMSEIIGPSERSLAIILLKNVVHSSRSI